MAALTEHVPVEQIREKAAALDPAVAAAAALRLLLVLLALPFLLLGWVARIVVRCLWAAAAWVWAAVLVGWAQAGPRPETEDGS